MSVAIQHTVRVEAMPKDPVKLAVRVTLEQALWWHMGGRADLKAGFSAEKEAKARVLAYHHMVKALQQVGLMPS